MTMTENIPAPPSPSLLTSGKSTGRMRLRISWSKIRHPRISLSTISGFVEKRMNFSVPLRRYIALFPNRVPFESWRTAPRGSPSRKRR